jgi:hypothetical protein
MINLAKPISWEIGKIKMVADKPCGEHYRIVVKGHLDSRWSQWFEGLDIRNLPGGEPFFQER